MKKNMLLFVFVTAMHFMAAAQKKQNRVTAFTRCFTMERVQQYLHANPATRSTAQQSADINTTKNSNANRGAGVDDIVSVPVVFHIVLPNPYTITDAIVQSQLDELNLAFAGLNADSTNATAFYPVRGHSAKIRFVLAKRTPAGTLSNGIDRIKSLTASNATLATDPIKRTQLGGADVWDPVSYLNFWVGQDASGKRILGYAQFPEAGAGADDGVFCNSESFGISSCNNNAYNRGRTMVHETGHYFGLFHIWGDEDGCDGDDFRALTDAGSTVVLPGNLFNLTGQGNTIADIGDTPNQGASTSTCLSGIVTDGCAVSAPGKMYQNYMDYTADNCYSMFTKKQVERMEWILDNVRTGFKTSLGGTAPTGAVALDVSLYEPVTPGGVEAIGCASFIYPSVLNCAGLVTPKIRIRNNGMQAITSLTVGLKVNGLAQLPMAVNTGTNGLISGETMVINFPAITATNGTYNLQFYILNVNGGGKDLVASNDTLTTTLIIADGDSLPVTEGFESLPFPAAKWSIYNPDGDATWARFNVGSNSNSSLFIDNFSKDNTGLTDELRTPKFIVPTTDSVIIAFDLAHKNYPGLNDELSILVSNDCEATWTTVFAKSGDSLATAGSTTLRYASPDAADWKNQRIVIGGSLVSSGEIIIAFRNTGDYGNNIFIDNINVYRQSNRDIAPKAIISPADFECAQNTVTPQIEISNNGRQTINSFKVGYTINNDNPVYKNFTQIIAPGTKVVVTLSPFTVPKDTSTFRVFTTDPENILGTGDENSRNDTLSKTFLVNKIINKSLTEDFEKDIFPPSDWYVITTGSANPWVRKSAGSKSSFSAFADNFSADFTGKTTRLKTSAINVYGADAVSISFDLAYKNYPGASDGLSVKVSTDCGNTFSTVFSKSGAALATAGSSMKAYVQPVATDWKTQTIALDSTFTAGRTIIVAFENTSNHGNNIFLDNINILQSFKRDLQMVAVRQPSPANCNSGSIEPVVVVANTGTDTIKAFKVAYAIDNGPLTTTTITNSSLPSGEQLEVKLNTFNGTPGKHSFTIFGLDPTTSTGTGDSNTLNDTLHTSFIIVGSQPTLPLAENFEGTIFPPVNWGVLNPDGDTTWVRSVAAASKGVGCMVINNFNNAIGNTTDKFISPTIVNNSKNDSLFVSFDFAYKQGSTYPGSTVFPLDTLEVQVTKDCGVTYQTVWKKWGENLQTVNDPNTPVLTSFIPSKNNWKNIRCYLTPFVGKDNFQVYFVAKSNKQNNIWIDNVNIYAKVLPQQLKDQGYLIYPNPFHNNFLIHHYAAPVNLTAVQAYNSAGQLVFDKRYHGNAPTEITVDLTEKANGVYMLKLFYTNKTIEEKIIKQ